MLNCRRCHILQRCQDRLIMVPSQHISVKECSLKAFCSAALLVFFKRPFNLCHNHFKHIRWIPQLDVTVCFAGRVFAGRGDRFQTQAVYDKQTQQYILMPFDSWAPSVGFEIFLLTSAELSNALCQCERQFKRQAGEAVIQSEVLRISPGSSSFSNYPPVGILAVLDNNGCPGVRLSPLKCGWREPTWGAGTGKCLLFLLCHLRSTTPEPKLCGDTGRLPYNSESLQPCVMW